MASEPYIGTIFMFAGNFAPYGYALCQGQLLAIQSNSALYSILGTTYGGNGTTNFALPDLRSRFPVGAGIGPGLSIYVAGETGGAESAVILAGNLPQHSHTVNCDGTGTGTGGSTFAAGTGQNPSGNYPGVAASPANAVYSTNKNTTMNSGMINPTGNNEPLLTVPPFTAINFIIAITGLFPSRN